MKIIPLSRGMEAIVDDSDFEWLNQWKWYSSDRGYAYRFIRTEGKRDRVWIHRLVIGAPNGVHVDHADGNKLNNTKSNLRFATFSENARNRVKYASNKTGYKGVSFFRGKYVAQIQVTSEGIRKNYYLGQFSNIHDAALAYNTMALLLHGEFANLNELHGEPTNNGNPDKLISKRRLLCQPIKMENSQESIQLSLPIILVERYTPQPLACP